MTVQDPDPSSESPSTIRRWRLWASAAVVGFVVLAIAIGFFVISSRGEDGIEGALGIDHRHDEAAPAVGAAVAAPPPTMVAWTSTTLALLDAASPEAGRAIAVPACAGCHGENGIAVAAAFPNLAGQHSTAIYKQLRDYAGGSAPLR